MRRVLKAGGGALVALALVIAGCGGGGSSSSRRSTSASGVTPAPRITNVIPQSAQAGAQVAILGTGFGQSPTAQTVHFRGAPATVLSASGTQLVVEVPAIPPGQADITVAIGSAASAPATFFVTASGAAAAALTSIAPDSGPVGTPVTAVGSGFGQSPTVTVGGVQATTSNPSDTRVTFSVPATLAVGSHAVVVTGPGGPSQPQLFQVTAPAGSPATLTGLNPASGAAGTTVQASGSGFGTSPSVTVGGVAVSAANVTQTSLSFTVPSLAAGGHAVVVTGPGGASNAVTYTVTQPSGGQAAQLVRLDPPGGVAGQLVSLRGASFGTAAPTVQFGASPATLIDHTEASATVRVPGGLAAGPVSVTVTRSGGSASNALTFQAAQTRVTGAATFSAAGTMTSPRTGHTATLLADGRVLIAGGDPSGGVAATATAEVYDPATGAFTPTLNAMTSPRQAHTATRLPDGRVLLAGGLGDPGTGLEIYFSTDIYDPATRTFTRGPDMQWVRDNHVAVPLASGDVLLAGGEGVLAAGGSPQPVATCEYYRFQPGAPGYFDAAPTLNVPRLQAAALPTFGGAVLIGGLDDRGIELVSTEILDQVSGAWSYFSPAGRAQTQFAMNSPRVLPAAVRTADGSIAVFGGIAPYGLDALLGYSTPDSLEVMPITGATAGWFTIYSPTPQPRAGHSATVLADDRILIAGSAASAAASQSATVYDTTATAISIQGLPMQTARFDHRATLLFDGRVLLTGGGGNATTMPGLIGGVNLAVTASAELFTP